MSAARPQAPLDGSPVGLLWLAAPFVAFALVLPRLWFNAPIWDDFDLVLGQTIKLLDAPSLSEWMRLMVKLHNEHRTAVSRLGSFTIASLTGQIDFRVMIALGVATVFGMAALLWLEFRKEVPAPLFAAAGLLVFQWTYYEAALMGSAALANLTVVSFSFAALFFATREGRASVAATIVFGLLAAGSMANGLFAMPIAAAGAVLARQRGRALLYGAIAITLWVLYFTGYKSPGGHPSPFAALDLPIAAAQLYLLLLGSIRPGIWVPTVLGAVAVLALAWMARKRIWDVHPTVVLWVLFILASTAALTAGRVGFGVVHVSRYALYSSMLAAIVLLSVAALTRPWPMSRVLVVILACAALNAEVTYRSWRGAQAYALDGHRLAKVVPASPEMVVRPYFGIYYPAVPEAEAFLVAAEKRGLYVPRVERVYPATVRMVASVPAGARLGGSVDRVAVEGTRVVVVGWSDIPATVAQRSFLVFPTEGAPSTGTVATLERADVAKHLRQPNLGFSGFRFELEYPSEEMARAAAAVMCVVVEAPGAGPVILQRTAAPCAAALAARLQR